MSRQVPPTSIPRSNSRKSSIPACMSLIAMPSPENPEPIIIMRARNGHPGEFSVTGMESIPVFYPSSLHADHVSPWVLAGATGMWLYSSAVIWKPVMEKPTRASDKPIVAEVEQGREYWWCACGRSARQPFCDGSHRGSAFQPIKFVAQESGKIWFCGCKESKKAPLCDGSHNPGRPPRPPGPKRRQ